MIPCQRVNEGCVRCLLRRDFGVSLKTQLFQEKRRISGEKTNYKHAHRSLTGRQALTEHVCKKSEALFEGHTKKSQLFSSGKPSGTALDLGNVSCGEYKPRGFTVHGCLFSDIRKVRLDVGWEFFNARV